MSEPTPQQSTFDAIRQFVVVPDRRYAVECRDDALAFHRTGSQFDRAWLVRGARGVLGERAAQAFERTSRGKLLVGGLALAAGSVLVLMLVGGLAVSVGGGLDKTHFRAMGVLVFAFIVGLVMVIAAVASSAEGTPSTGRHDFELRIADVTDAMLLPPQSEIARRGEPQVARVHLEAEAHGTIRLGIPTEADLETIKRAIPRLAA